MAVDNEGEHCGNSSEPCRDLIAMVPRNDWHALENRLVWISGKGKHGDAQN